MKIRREPQPDQDGFTILELVIAAGLIGVIAIAGARIFAWRMKSNDSADFSAASNALFAEMVDHLSLPGVCRETFQGRAFVPDPVISVNSIADTQEGAEPRYVTKEKDEKRYYANRQIRIKSIRLEKFEEDGPDRLTGRSALRVDFEKDDGTRVISKSIGVDVRVASLTAGLLNRKITDCFTPPAPRLDSLRYLSRCSIWLGHEDTGGSKGEAETELKLSGPGYAGIQMTGGLDDNDYMWLRASCTDAPEKSFERYFRDNCDISIGHRDETGGDDEDPEVGHFATIGITGDKDKKAKIKLDGKKVDGNDSFYVNMSCLEPSAESPDVSFANHLRRDCAFCIGWADFTKPDPYVRGCRPVQLLKSKADYRYWTRIMTSGKADGNDMFYIGFFCGTNHVEVQRITYR